MLDFLKFAIPVAGAGFAWYWNERRKRISDEYEKKAERYTKLIESLQGFYEGVEQKEAHRLKSNFIIELNNCWLYCPDEVINKAYNFLLRVHDGQQFSDEIKEKAVGELMIEIRKDLLTRKPLRRTSLKASDFKLLKAN